MFIYLFKTPHSLKLSAKGSVPSVDIENEPSDDESIDGVMAVAASELGRRGVRRALVGCCGALGAAVGLEGALGAVGSPGVQGFLPPGK